MQTANLTGAQLDYHVSRAEGVPAADLELRANGTLCVRNIRGTPGKIAAVQVLDYSTNWALTGPLVEKGGFKLDMYATADGVSWCADRDGCAEARGDTPLIAVCRAVVRAAFGDEVEDLPCA